MNILVALPLLPLLGVLWFGLTRRGDRQAGFWVVALAAFFTIAVALLATSQHLETSHLLVRGRTALALDDAARPALLLFGSLWLAAALLARGRPHGPAPMTLLLGLSAAATLGIARGGPLVFAALLATGFGLYGIIASEAADRWRGRWLVTLLVASDLLIFETLLHQTAHPGNGTIHGFVLLTGIALLLRSGAPPAHAWLPAALSRVGAPTAILIAGVPAGAAFIGGRQLLGPAVTGIDTESGFAILAVLGIGLAGALWSARVALRASGSRITLAYAAAVTAALLLITTPMIKDTVVSAWAVVALALCCAAVPAIACQHGGWSRNASITLLLASQGLAAAQAAVLATADRSAGIGFLAALVAGSSTLLLTMALRRTREQPRDADSVEAAAVALALTGLVLAGLWILWQAGGVQFDSFWPAPAGVTLGLLLARKEGRTLPAGRLRSAGRRLAAVGLLCADAIDELCRCRLPRERDRLQAAVAGLWRGESWAERIARLESMLRLWPATALLMLFVAIAAASLLAS